MLSHRGTFVLTVVMMGAALTCAATTTSCGRLAVPLDATEFRRPAASPLELPEWKPGSAPATVLCNVSAAMPVDLAPPATVGSAPVQKECRWSVVGALYALCNSSLPSSPLQTQVIHIPHAAVHAQVVWDTEQRYSFASRGTTGRGAFNDTNLAQTIVNPTNSFHHYSNVQGQHEVLVVPLMQVPLHFWHYLAEFCTLLVPVLEALQAHPTWKLLVPQHVEAYLPVQELGVRDEQVVKHDWQTTMHARHMLVVTQRPVHLVDLPDGQLLKALRQRWWQVTGKERFAAREKEIPRRILIVQHSCMPDGARNLRNAEALVVALEGKLRSTPLDGMFTVEVDCVGERPRVEQQEAFHDAAMVIMAAGSATGNLLYSRPHTPVIVIHAGDIGYLGFYNLAAAWEVDYIMAKAGDWGSFDGVWELPVDVVEALAARGVDELAKRWGVVEDASSAMNPVDSKAAHTVGSRPA